VTDLSLLKRYSAPRIRSIVAPGGRLLPARSHGVEALTVGLDGQGDVVQWSPWFTIGADELGPRMSSGPQRGRPTRKGTGTAYVTPAETWNLAGIASGWSRPGVATPSRQPTTQLAIGRGWTPIAGGTAPLPGLPEPARMVTPRLPGR
jgi:hypothetical protein